MMMSFCRKSVHSFLGLTNPNCNNNNYYNSSFEPIKSSSSLPTSPSSSTTNTKHGLGLITIDDDDKREESYQSPTRSPRVVESSVMKRGGVGGGVPAKKDPGGIGFIDEFIGCVDGLMSCTESLGFESSNERIVDDKIGTDQMCGTSQSHWEKVKEKRTKEMKQYPPPLPWLNNGQPSFFLRPVRKDGRLELMEVRIDKPEILRAYRENGRLRLHLVREEDDQESEDEQIQSESYEEEEEDEEEIGEDLIEEENQEVEESSSIGEWKFPVAGEALIRRCNEPVVVAHHHHNMSHHHHPNLHVWGQQYVATR